MYIEKFINSMQGQLAICKHGNLESACLLCESPLTEVSKKLVGGMIKNAWTLAYVVAAIGVVITRII